MEIGTKIRKVRELKGFSQENMAEELGMSINGYGKIERNEVNLGYDKLLRIAQILDVNIEAIVGFDDKVAFNNFNNKVEWQVGNYNMPAELKQLYEDKIELLKDKIKYLQSQLDYYTNMNKSN